MFIFPTVYGEFDVEVNGETKAKHRYHGNYKLGYMFACELNLKIIDIINTKFINKKELTGHHGVFEPTRITL